MFYFICAIQMAIIIFLVDRISSLIAGHTMHNFNIYYIQDVAIISDWEDYYTLNRNQHSDDGVYLWAVGQHEVELVQSFTTSQEMFEWCYGNGWTKPTEEDL